MDKEKEILSEITIFGKYAKYIPKEQRRETWQEICDRYEVMMALKYPQLIEQIHSNMKLVREKKVLPSMRAMQFAGKPVDINNSRLYNCAYLPIDDYRAFSEAMFLLLGGTGVGYSVQFAHIAKLPDIIKPTKIKRYLIGDSIEGWADAVKMLMKSYFGKTNYKPSFDFRDIRQKGARLVTAGGKAPGPEPLKRCLFEIEQIFERKSNGEKLNSLEVHDILCHIADAVLAGGIRRAAMIALFSLDDENMLNCKSGNYWELNGQRDRANNSAVILRSRIKKEDFDKVWNRVKNSLYGEPGLYFSNNVNWGTNPCCEIALRPYQFCNLVELNGSNITSQEDFNERARVGSFFGTLQAGFTDFHYLRDIWKKTTEKDALIGVGITGIGSNIVTKLNKDEAINIVYNTNKAISSSIGINSASRLTTIKPSGTTSCVLGSSSGIHAWHNNFYLRRQRIGKNEALYTYFSIYHPELIEDDLRNSKQAIICIPQSAPKDSIIRTESTLDLLERVKDFNINWVKAGHISGDNTNNVSATLSIDENKWYKNPFNELDNYIPCDKDDKSITKKNEWNVVGEWMWKNKDYFNGLSTLRYDGGSYVQAPFENISEEEYISKSKHLKDVDLSKVVEMSDDTTQAQELACAGGNCEIV